MGEPRTVKRAGGGLALEVEALKIAGATAGQVLKFQSDGAGGVEGVPGDGGGGAGATNVGDLADIGAMGEPIAQADNLTEVVTALGGASAVRTAISAAGLAALSYDFSGGAHDYTADSNYAPSSSTSTIRANAESALLGDGVTVPKFHVFGRDFVSALARTTTPGLKVTMTSANGEQLLRTDSTTESGANLLIPLPWWAIVIPDWTIDLTIATNLAATPCTSGSNFASCRVGLLRYHESDGIPYTVCVADLYTYAGDAAGTLKEGRTLDGSSDTATDISGETSGGVNVRVIRIARSGALITLSTGPNSGSLTERRKILNYKRRVGISPLALCVGVGQGKATPSAGYYGELRALTITPG